MRSDWLHDDFSACEDLKTTARSGAPEQFSRSLFGIGYDVQAAFYARGIRAVSGRDCAFRLVVVETQPPYAVSVFQLTPAALALANQKIDFALKVWADCLKHDRWPSYPRQVMHVEPPTWEETRMYEREYREEGEA
jgi:hypothetical protein